MRKRDLTVSSIACHRVFGHLSAPSKVSVQVQSTPSLAHPRTRPRTHAAMQPVCVAWKSRSHGCPGNLPDGERGAPAEPAVSLGEVWRTVRGVVGVFCGAVRGGRGARA